jgi:tetratricopeptide (TPR) repeat protein
MIARRIFCLLFVSAFATSVGAAPEPASPAQEKIAAARKAIEKNPGAYRPYVDLALGLARRARETSNVAHYREAEEVLQKSFALRPDNYEAAQARVWVLLGQHEFARALEAARALNGRAPDDVLTYGFLTDAHVELGNYVEAEEACQWMLDLRPGNVPGLTRAAYLRELFGDPEGAIELMTEAFGRTPETEVEDRAWIMTQIAHLQLMRAKLDAAEAFALEALSLFPDYHYALATLAAVRSGQERHGEAVDLLRKRYQGAPHPENLYSLAEALERAGRSAEARAAYSEFEAAARRESEGWDNANRELVFYYADRARKPEEALRVARLERERRKDVHTLDAYAWALAANGEAEKARQEIETALAVGIRDARILYHAGVIAAKDGDPGTATRYLEESLALNPFSDMASSARDALASLKSAAAPRPTKGDR